MRYFNNTSKQILRKVAKDDWQFLVPFLICTISFIATDFFVFFDKADFAYWSGGLLEQPHRIISSHFIHFDAKHLLANTFGIIFARYCLKALGLNGNYFFLLLVGLLVPSQTLIFWFSDIFLFKNPMSFAVGFSGIIYGVEAFILLSSIFGKQYFLSLNINLKKSLEIRQAMILLIFIGMVYSLLPGISLLGHITGIIAGSLIFLF